jgi:tetratricopeptide (TPR) repeat protein
MASIFLSYAREDFAKAQRIAKCLEAVGHSVWWDRQLQPGERFSAEIDKALKGADAVVALWSKASIDSPWVQDEAAVGRDSGRLVPALLEPVTPPLGFRQYHAADLSRKRLDARSTQPLVKAVEDRLSGKRTETTAAAAAPLLSRRGMIAVAVLLVLFAAAAAWWFLRPAASSSPSVVVEAAEGSGPMAEMLARSIGDELGRFRAGPLASLDIKRDNGRSATYLAKVEVIESPTKVTLELSLASRRAANLWSTNLDGAPNQGAELNRQAAAMLGAALQCDLDIDKRHYALTANVRALYVDGCARLADPRTFRNEAIDTLRQVTKKAPRFAPGWAKLAYAEFSGIDFVPPSEASNLAWTAGRHSETAQRLEPNLPEYYYVRAFDRQWRPDSSAEALSILDQGLHRNSDSALLHGGRADALLRVGRITEAVESAKRATDLNPLSPAMLGAYVMALTYDGQTRAAERALETAESTWPRSASIAGLRYAFDLRYADPANALRMLRENEVPDVTTDERTQLYLQARDKPTAANIEAALRSYREAFQKNPSDPFGYLQALAQFGRVDEAYRVLAAAPIDSWYANGDTLFKPFMKKIWADPRFIQFANRIGLLALWRKSGVWPDFCGDPQLPYDCRKEANKYPLQPPR